MRIIKYTHPETINTYMHSCLNAYDVIGGLGNVTARAGRGRIPENLPPKPKNVTTL